MAHQHSVPVGPTTRRSLTGIALALALVTAIGMVVLRPGDGSERPDLSAIGAVSEFYDGEVVGIDSTGCRGVPAGGDLGCYVATVRLLAGPDEGETTRLEFPESASSPDLEEGDRIVLSYYPNTEPGFEYNFADRARKPVLFWLAAGFALSVVLLGRLRGLAALVGLGASLAVLLLFTLPAIIDGRSPVGVAVVSAAAISFFALYVAHGFGPMTTVALLGTMASLVLTALLAVVFVAVAEFSGFATEEGVYLQAAGGSIDLQGMLLAGVIIGALGALDDMTVTQTSAVWELRAADPTMPTRTLLAAGMRIGRDHVASTVNTLFLAYAGASMPLLVLFVLSEQSLGTVANSEVVATEIVRTLVGSIGLVAAVPLTTWLAARTTRPGQALAPRRSRMAEVDDEEEW